LARGKGGGSEKHGWDRRSGGTVKTSREDPSHMKIWAYTKGTPKRGIGSHKKTRTGEDGL